MSEAAVDTAQEDSPDFLGMSDEDFANLDPNLVETLEYPEEEEVESEGELEEDLETEDDVLEDGDSDDSGDDSDPDLSPDDSDVGDDDTDSGDTDDTDDAEDDSDSDDSAALDFEAEYKKLMAPFRANGKEMQITNVDDALQLMKMGANYNKKMAGLKPSMGLVKMLEKNDLLSEEKLSFLIDVSRKDPAAIAKLLKDSDINPLEMDLDDSEKYVETDHSVDPRELDLDNVIEDLKGDEHFQETIGVVDGWDENSKQAVANDPQLLRAINDQMSNGIYKLISTTVESEQMLGRLQGLTNLQAYQSVGDQIQKRNGFAHLFPETQQEDITPEPAPKKGDEGRKAKRRAASPTKKTATKKPVEKAYDPLALSDEEFIAQGDSKFL